MPGYRIQSAYAQGGRLTLNMAAAFSPGRHQFQILITAVPVGFSPPADCLGAQPVPAILAGDGAAPCLPAGKNKWSRHGGDAVQLIERRGVLIAAIGSAATVGLPTLTEALRALRPTSVAALQSAGQ